MTAPRPTFDELLEPSRATQRGSERHAARRPLSERGWFQYSVIASLTALAIALALVAMLLMRELAA